MKPLVRTVICIPLVECLSFTVETDACRITYKVVFVLTAEIVNLLCAYWNSDLKSRSKPKAVLMDFVGVA